MEVVFTGDSELTSRGEGLFRLAWLTDPHFDFLTDEQVTAFGEKILGEVSCDGLVITGDISVYTKLVEHLSLFKVGFTKPVWFVLGNHDFYYGSFERMKERFKDWGEPQGCQYLAKPGTCIQLSAGTCLVGVDGWYDGAGGMDSRLEMTDFSVIYELSGLPRSKALDVCAARVAAESKKAEVVLRYAATQYKEIIFATHVPPFKEATWHNGGHSDGTWLPFMCNRPMGQVIRKVAAEFPDVKFQVLCGHTHSWGVYYAADNVVVYTGVAEYGHPGVTGVLNITAIST